MTVQKDGSVLYAVYGTLRKGWGNNRLLQNDGVEFLGSTNTDPSYTMYHLGGFPGVAENGETRIAIEVYRVTNPAVVRNVNALEGYSGTRGSDRNWYDTCEVKTEWGMANMFTMNELNDRQTARKITSGDWANQK